MPDYSQPKWLHLFDVRADESEEYDLVSLEGSVCGWRVSCQSDPETPSRPHPDCELDGCVLEVVTHRLERRRRRVMCDRRVPAARTVQVAPGRGDVEGGRRLRRRVRVQGVEVCDECRVIYEARIAELSAREGRPE